jgi:hypothetical protein
MFWGVNGIVQQRLDMDSIMPNEAALGKCLLFHTLHSIFLTTAALAPKGIIKSPSVFAKATPRRVGRGRGALTVRYFFFSHIMPSGKTPRSSAAVVNIHFFPIRQSEARTELSTTAWLDHVSFFGIKSLTA